MKKLVLVAGLIIALVALLGGGLAFRALSGGSDSALAASKSNDDIFSQLAGNQNGTTSDQPWLGIQVKRTANGPTISAVVADSPAEKAGLQRGDVITAVNGTPVSDVQALLDTVEGLKVGDTVTLTVTRGGASQDITATLEARPAPLAGANPIIPELSGVSPDQLFSHIQNGSLTFTDKDGKSHTATADLGTVSSVDAGAKKLTLDLNAGDSKTYDLNGVTTVPADLSKFANGDKVVVISVDGNLRLVAKGGSAMGFLGKGGMRGFGGWKGFGMMGNGDENGTNSGNSQGLHMPMRTLGSSVDYR